MQVGGKVVEDSGQHDRWIPGALGYLANARSNRLVTVVARDTYSTPVSGNLAASRHRRRTGVGDNAGACRDRLCSRIRRAGHLWSLRDDRAAAGLCACSAPVASWSWDRTHRWPPSFSASSCRSLAEIPLRAVALAGMMAVVSGIVCILAGVARLGFVTELLSKPIRYGYMNGIALTVLISQLPKLFGFSIESDGPLRNLWAIAEAVLGGRTNWTAFAVGAGTLAAILLLKNSKRVPGILVAVVGATAIVGVLDLAARADVSVLGPLPQGLPAFAIPWITYADIVPVLIGGCAVALVSFADTSVLSRAYAARTGTRCRSQSGDGRTWRRQSGGRLLSGLSDQQQFVTHSCGGGCGRPNAVDRGRRCARRCAAAVGGTEPAPASARRRIGRGRHRLGHRLDRGRPTSFESIAFSLGSSGYRSSASWASPFLAPSRA